MSTTAGINPGRFNKHLEVWRYAEVKSAIGAIQNKLIMVRRVWAEVKPSRGTEFLEYYREANQCQYKVTCRYFTGLTEKDVLVLNGRQFEINAIINIDESNTYYEIQCTEQKDTKVLSDGG